MAFVGYSLPKRRASARQQKEACAQGRRARPGRGRGIRQGIAQDRGDRAVRSASHLARPSAGLAQRAGAPREQDAARNSPSSTASWSRRSSSPTICRSPPKGYQIRIHGTRRRPAASSGSATCWCSSARPQARRSRRRGARAGLRHEGDVGVGGVRRRGQARGLQAGRQPVGAAHPSERGDPQQPRPAAVLQGHAQPARPARSRIQAPARRDLARRRSPIRACRRS